MSTPLNHIVNHFWPQALVIFVKRFQANKTSTDINDLIGVASNVGNIKEIKSVRISRTIKNSPGTFSLTIVDTANKFIIPDNAEKEIDALYRSSKRATLKIQNTSGIKRRTVESPKSSDSPQDYLNKVNETTYGVEETDVANSYGFKNFKDWLEGINIAVESLEGNDMGERYITQTIRSRSTNNIAERWAVDIEGNTIIVSSSESDENNLIKELTSNSNSIQVNEFTIAKKSLLNVPATVKNRNGVQKNYKIIGVKNRVFDTKWKDVNEQSNVPGIYNKGKCAISPMDRVVIFLPERYQTGREVRLVKAFTGVVSTVQQGYSENQNLIEVKGEDITKYLQISVVNVNPALPLDAITVIDQNPQDYQTIFTNIFRGMSIPNIVKSLLLGSDPSDNTAGRITGVGVYRLAGTPTSTDITYNADKGVYERIDKRNKGDGNHTVTADFRQVLGELFSQSTVHILNPFTDAAKLKGYSAYRLQLQSSWSHQQADFKTRRDLIYQSAEEIGFVFYADRNGELWFRQPYFDNSHIVCAKNPNVYIIKNEEIISFGFIEDDSHIYSSVYVTTEPDLGGESLSSIGFYTASWRDDNTVLKYGQRIFVGSNPVIRTGTKESIQLYAKSLLQRILAGKYQGEITIPGRVELDPGYPIYIPIRNMMYYIETIDWALDYAGQYTTTLGLSFGRKPWEHLSELFTFSPEDEVYQTDGQLYDDTIEFNTGTVLPPITKTSISQQTKNLPIIDNPNK